MNERVDHGPASGPRSGRAAARLVNRRPKGSRAAPLVLLTAIILAAPAPAQQPTTPPDCSTGRDLLTIPEVKHENGKLKAVLVLSDEYRSMADASGRCEWQHMRYFKGWNVAADPPPSRPSNGEPIPGPTLRARIGDLIQISFLNQIDTKNFPFSLDQGERGKTAGCDEATGTDQDPQDETKTIKVSIYPRNDSMPNCLHGSSTANVHFHGTHTTPSTTGDNVLLYIRPALRVKGRLEPTDAFVKSAFGRIFDSCEKNGPPKAWGDLPVEWRAEQERLLKLYDATAPYQGINGNLPAAMKLWPNNEDAIKQGLWPQFSVGASPYCFRVPDYDAAKPKVKMGQAPGIHWYHAHKHGSTALNVGNGMTGALIIEGPYDDRLRDFYKSAPGGLEEHVLVIQQLEPSLKMLSIGAGFNTAPLSVNGRRQPVISMRPGQVQLWRIVNGAPRNFLQFLNFVPQPGTTPCSDTGTPCVDWRQTAQDGVQFHPDNYDKIGRKNTQFNMAAANRVDLLVRAPEKEGSYALNVRESVIANPTTANQDRESVLLTVKVIGTALDPPMDFIDKRSFPPFPAFLKDIPKEEVSYRRKLTFDTVPAPGRKGGLPPGDLPQHEIDNDQFSDKTIEQTMALDSVEEWTLVNKAVGIAHPFHIHINPFQVFEVFDPNSADAKSGGRCYADPKKPETWKACDALGAPFVWWDTLAIPSARQDTFDCVEQSGSYVCPIAEGSACSLTGSPPNQKQQCTVKIPGYFKMRSRFADFLGVFVQHCHILAHEDRGMMQLIQVSKERSDSPQRTGYTHY